MANYWASHDGSFNSVTTSIHIVGGLLFFVIGPVLELLTILHGEGIDEELFIPEKLDGGQNPKYRGPVLTHPNAKGHGHPSLLRLTHTTSRNDAYNTVRKSLLRCASATHTRTYPAPLSGPAPQCV